ncbi:ribosomal RNA small subunit methyltransferase E domain protein [Mycobacterium kansasii 732]|uniref:Ribosomal RNA small subunit methyltransferase E domain protein n=1 Tax=Mycobacterium kansasii TaxID=1768 RepID=A0A1V3XIA5_MYCKA|nr:ribosomal RNA small subunit methyltransferase E domain protein [Mycobacterium kansasii 732]OOK78929.1 ribosomal RNA small subunit methyltransferase E domain protein [Mycobacterium kansasii]
MAAMLFYVDALPDTGALAVVDGDEGFHAATVRRIRPGEEVVLGDGGATWPAAGSSGPDATAWLPGCWSVGAPCRHGRR